MKLSEFISELEPDEMKTSGEDTPLVINATDIPWEWNFPWRPVSSLLPPATSGGSRKYYGMGWLRYRDSDAGGIDQEPTTVAIVNIVCDSRRRMGVRVDLNSNLGDHDAPVP